MRAAPPFLRWKSAFSLVVLAFVLTTCTVESDPPTSTPTRYEKTASQGPKPTQTDELEEFPTLQPTAVMVTDVNVAVPTQKVLPTAAPDPLRFVYPESQPEPISAWRPPLYPIPWAPTPYDHFFFGRPIAADEVNWPLANYRYGGVFFEGVVHTGVDIPAARGTPVIAAGDGKVLWAGWGLYRGIVDDYSDPYGQAVVIRHDFGYQGYRLYTVYGHMDQVDVLRGQTVRMGDRLGLVGNTGFTTGPHLHFEVRLGESDFFRTFNPELWLVPPQGWGVLVARIMDTSGQLYADEELRIESRETGQVWKGIPYAGGAVNLDPYYQENLVISDLPAGFYDITISYSARFYYLTIEIHPGRVTYFSFRGKHGFNLEPPPEPGSDYLPVFSESP